MKMFLKLSSLTYWHKVLTFFLHKKEWHSQKHKCWTNWWRKPPNAIVLLIIIPLITLICRIMHCSKLYTHVTYMLCGKSNEVLYFTWQFRWCFANYTLHCHTESHVCKLCTQNQVYICFLCTVNSLFSSIAKLLHCKRGQTREVGVEEL